MTEPSQEDIKKLSREEQAFIKSLEAGETRNTASRLLVAARARAQKDEAEAQSRAEIAALKDEVAFLKANVTRTPTFVRPTSAGAVGRLPNEIVNRIFMLLVHEGRALKEVLHVHLDHNKGVAARLDMLVFAETCSQWRAVVQAYRAKYLSIPALHPELVIDSDTSHAVEHLSFRGSPHRSLIKTEVDRLLQVMTAFLPVHGQLVSYLSLGGGRSILVGLLADRLPGGPPQLEGLIVQDSRSTWADEDAVVAAIPTLASLRTISLLARYRGDTAAAPSAAYSQRVLLALAALPNLASIDIIDDNYTRDAAPTLVFRTPAFASTALRRIQLARIPGLSLDSALRLAYLSAATLEFLALSLSKITGSAPAPSPPLVQFRRLKTLDIRDSRTAGVWAEVPLLAVVLEQSPALETLSLSSFTFNDDGRGRVSPTQRLKDKISNGVIKQLTLSGWRHGQPAEFLQFIDNREWPPTLGVTINVT